MKSFSIFDMADTFCARYHDIKVAENGRQIKQNLSLDDKYDRNISYSYQYEDAAISGKCGPPFVNLRRQQ